MGYTQLRNVSESSTGAIKRLLLQLTQGMKVKSFFDLEFIVEVIAAEHNNTPFLESGNSQLWAPIDGIIPRVGLEPGSELVWKGDSSMERVKQLATRGKEIGELVRQALINTFLQNMKFWMPKTFRGRNQVEPKVGDLIRIVYNSMIGVIEEVYDQTLMVRLRGSQRMTVHRTNVDIIVSRAISTVPTMSEEGVIRKNVFLSVPVEDECKDILLEVQTKLRNTVEGSVKWTKDSALHCTLGLLNFDNEEQIREVKNRIDTAIESITSHHCGNQQEKCKMGFLAAIKNIEMWHNENETGDGFIVATMDQGYAALGNIRAAMEEILGSAISEKQGWKGHVTIGRNVMDSPKNYAAINSINIGKKGEPTIGAAFPMFKIELRWLKKVEVNEDGKEALSESKKFESKRWFTDIFPDSMKESGVIASWNI